MGVAPSASAVSRLNHTLTEQFEAWRVRPLLADSRILYLDGIHFKVRHGTKTDSTIILTALGVDMQGNKEVLALRACAEARQRWLELSDAATGVEHGLGSREIEMIPDRNDAATFLIASVLGHGPVTVSPLRTDHLLPLLDSLKQCGAQFEIHPQGINQSLTIQCDEFRPVSLDIVSRPYPGFSTDWGPMMQVLMSQLPSTSTLHETIF